MPLQRIPGAMVSDSTITAADLAPGAAARIVQDTAKAATGTSVDFTGIPSWAKRVTVLFNAVSGSGTSPIRIRLGTSAGFETTGYVGWADIYTTTFNATSITDGIGISAVGSSTVLYTTVVTISLVTGNVWNYTSRGATGGGSAMAAAGTKTLAGTLDRIRATFVEGSNTFDAGTINIMYEG